jgi:hypothetical protein
MAGFVIDILDNIFIQQNNTRFVCLTSVYQEFFGHKNNFLYHRMPDGFPRVAWMKNEPDGG